MPHRPVVECGDLHHVTFREKKKAGAAPEGTAPAAQNKRADRATTPVGQSPAGLLAGLPRRCVKFRRAVAARLSRTEKGPTHADADVAARDAFCSRRRRDTAGGRLRRGRPARRCHGQGCVHQGLQRVPSGLPRMHHGLRLPGLRENLPDPHRDLPNVYRALGIRFRAGQGDVRVLRRQCHDACRAMRR